uniref:Uncharacterized protein n=1 Tax=Panagrolaimus sp. ES5 TaxID=591445 RepID=A0AC34G8U2_9BILA
MEDLILILRYNSGQIDSALQKKPDTGITDPACLGVATLKHLFGLPSMEIPLKVQGTCADALQCSWDMGKLVQLDNNF